MAGDNQSWKFLEKIKIYIRRCCANIYSEFLCVRSTSRRRRFITHAQVEQEVVLYPVPLFTRTGSGVSQCVYLR